MRRYTPFALLSSTGAAPPGSVSPFPGTFNVHSGAFSFTSRFADAYSARTFFQSHWSSSATIIGFTVSVPVPSSVWPTRMVTVSSGAIVIQALISGTAASRYQGWAATGTLAASALGGSQKPRTIAPPTAPLVSRNSRRSMSVVFCGASSLSDCSGFSLMTSSFYLLRPAGLALLDAAAFRPCTSRAPLIPLTSQLGGPVDCLTYTMIGSASAGIGHLGIDVGIRWVWLLFEQCHRCQDLPRLAVATLRNIELLPRQLDRVRPVGRQSFDGGDLPASGPTGLQQSGHTRL